MASKTVVLAFFNDEATADDAVESLKKWDKADDNIKLDAIGVLALDDKGKLKTHKLGKRSVGKGAGIGLVLAVIAPPTLIAGVVGGGVIGALHHKGLGLKAADRDRIASQLTAGQAAVGVLVGPTWRSTSPPSSPSSVGKPRPTRCPKRPSPRSTRPPRPSKQAQIAAGDDLSILDGVGPTYATRSRRAASPPSPRSARRPPSPSRRSWSRQNQPLIAGHTADTWPRQATLAARQGVVGAAALHRLHEEGGRRLDLTAGSAGT